MAQPQDQGADNETVTSVVPGNTTTAEVTGDKPSAGAGPEKAVRSQDQKSEGVTEGDGDLAPKQRREHKTRPTKNNKANFEAQAESSDAQEIRRQVEFYFSDSNLPIDAFLFEKVGGHENRPVPLDLIHSFKRMRHFKPFSAVSDAVKESELLDLNEQNEITRKTPLDKRFTSDVKKNRELVHEQSMYRSIYAKGFGREDSKTHLDIEAFFETYGPINSVRLRRYDNGTFKGSVFVEFATEELQQKFLALDPPPPFFDHDLEVKSKKQYVDDKFEGDVQGIARQSESHSRRGTGDRRGGGGRRGDYGHDDKGRNKGGRGGKRGGGRYDNRNPYKKSRGDDDEGNNGTRSHDKTAASVRDEAAETKKRPREEDNEGKDAEPEAKKAKEGETATV